MLQNIGEYQNYVKLTISVTLVELRKSYESLVNPHPEDQNTEELSTILLKKMAKVSAGEISENVVIEYSSDELTDDEEQKQLKKKKGRKKLTRRKDFYFGKATTDEEAEEQSNTKKTKQEEEAEESSRSEEASESKDEKMEETWQKTIFKRSAPPSTPHKNERKKRIEAKNENG
ncbi:protein FAM133 [Hydra vulgaris]|uniref:protein FAM133 n=1 Tax=Hydra vulgaris TaxID=6087 RepID=UPI001F5EE6C7|nr:protein FAM133-like [Hydra vulgaris]